MIIEKYLNNKIHILYHNSYNKEKSIIFIHGIYGSSMTFLDLFDTELINYYNLYAVDLPGFGKTDNLEKNYKKLDIYYLTIDTIIETFDIKNCILCCHSFGSYLGIKYINQHSNNYMQIIKKMILISPAGLLPTLNEYGAYSALLFKIPEIRIIRIIFQKVIFPMISKMAYGQFLKNNSHLKLYINPNYCGDLCVSSRITINGINGIYWNDPQIEHLKIPCLVIHGKKDKLIPYYQGLLLKYLGHKLLLLEDSDHGPINKNTKNIISNWIIENEGLPFKQIKISRPIIPSMFPSSLSVFRTKCFILLLYMSIKLNVNYY